MITARSIGRSSFIASQLSQTNSDFARIYNQKNPFQSSSSSSTGNNLSTGNFTLSQDAQDAIKKLEKYNETSEKFYSGLGENMENLKSSSETLKKTDFSSEKSQDVINSVQQFVTDYNKTVKFLGDNSNLSRKASRVSDSFASTKYNKEALNSVGINVDKSGKLSIDTEKLNSSLTSNSKRVEEVLGSRGLAKQTATKVDLTLRNSNNMVDFPKISKNASTGIMQGVLLNVFA